MKAYRLREAIPRSEPGTGVSFPGPSTLAVTARLDQTLMDVWRLLIEAASDGRHDEFTAEALLQREWPLRYTLTTHPVPAPPLQAIAHALDTLLEMRLVDVTFIN